MTKDRKELRQRKIRIPKLSIHGDWTRSSDGTKHYEIRFKDTGNGELKFQGRYHCVYEAKSAYFEKILDEGELL